MNKFLLNLSILTSFSMLATTYVHAGPTAELTVRVNVVNNAGKVYAYLFLPGGDPMHVQTAARQVVGPINNGLAQFHFNNLSYGDYAVTVFHDVNDNGVLDHNWLRLPAEPLGFSNGFHVSLTSGLPTFDKLKFAIDKTANNLAIDLR